MDARNVLVPTVWEKTGIGERGYDIYSRLVKDRIIFMQGEIHDVSADLVIAQLLFCASEDQDKDISLYINSPGGSVTAGLAIYDTIQHIKPNVQTICMGQAASMAAILLAGGSAGKRFILPSARVLLHQPWGGAQGQASDVGIQAREIVRLKKLLISILSRHSGKKESELAEDMERDFFMDAQESVKYGIVDRILVRESNE